ncbi:MAG: hypothetical protein LBU99_04575 [Spirochaetaceae bacterium]|jgi:hypothetical protein|nr:hypothetical protein [Spirochaetaceae bacterium]
MTQSFVVNPSQTQDSIITRVYSNDVSSNEKVYYFTNRSGSRLIIDNNNHCFFLDSFTIKRDISPLFNKVVTNLIEKKEHLALQLNYEFGNLTEEEFNTQEERYLKEPEVIDKKALANDIQMLFDFTGRAFDAIELSEMFNCEIEAAEDSIQQLLFNGGTNA